MEREWWCVAVKHTESGQPCGQRVGLRTIGEFESVPIGWQPLCDDHARAFAEYVEREQRQRDWRANARTLYVVWRGPHMKVGVTGRLDERLRSLEQDADQTLRPTDDAGRLYVLITVPGTLVDEGSCHEALADHRVLGEWFTVSEHSLLALIGWLGEHVARHWITAEEWGGTSMKTLWDLASMVQQADQQRGGEAA